MTINKKKVLEELSYRRLHLYSDYRIVNSNHIFGQGTLPYIGHRPYRKQLEAFLSNSDGGAVLITGFRGVGKSTMVHNAVSTLNRNGLFRIIPISVVLPAEKTYGQVLVEIIRKLYETLSKETFWNKLKIETQERICLAYNRTMLNIKHSSNMSAESELSIQNPLGWLPAAKTKSGVQEAVERSYLAFSEHDVEYELIQCIEALYESDVRNKIVIIVDEIDKITATQEGMCCFDNLLERMKNIISSSNALFVFVAGIDIYMRWESDSQKINGLYDSLFDHHIYLPCIWDSVEELFDVINDKKYVYKPIKHEFLSLVETGYTTILEESFRMIEDYILFKGKGLPRRILGTFNDFVVWDDKQPCFLLTENRIQAILLVGKLLEKFRSYIFTAKITTIYERDIYYTLFFSMLEFLLFQGNTTFTNGQIKNILLKEQGTLGLYFDNALDELLGEFEKLAFIKKTGAGYEVIDDTLLKQDQSLRILDQDLLLSTQSIGQLPDRNDASIDERFHDQINLLHNAELTDFWNDYKAMQVIANSKRMMMFSVMLKRFGLKRFAIVYKDKKQIDIEGGSRVISDNLYSVGSYQFSGPYFLDTVDYIENGIPVTSLRTAADGYALVHLIEAKLKNIAIYQIICQVLSLLDYLHKRGFGNIRLKPDNIMICKNAAIKVLDLKHICRLGKDKRPCVTRIYSAPEVYLSVCSAATDYYSAGILLTEMVVGKSLSRYYTERHIDVKTVMANLPCSKKLKNILVKATAFDPEDRYTQGSDLINSLDKCPEFWRMKKIPIPKGKDGTVIGSNIKNMMSVIQADTIDDNVEETIKSDTVSKAKKDVRSKNPYLASPNLEDIDVAHTGILGGAYFDDKHSGILSDYTERWVIEAYLVRLSNNERIVLKKPVFRVGRDETKVDYCINNTGVSLIHIEFRQIDEKFYVKDLNSTNGTYINSERIESDMFYKIIHGDFIRIANEEFVFNER